MVRRWNGLRTNSLRGRRTVFVHLPVTPGSSPSWAAKTPAKTKSKKTIASAEATQPKPVVHHRVKEGETLTSIATGYHTSVAALKRDNGELSILRPGMVLLIRAR
jgi:LysM repeat protein